MSDLLTRMRSLLDNRPKGFLAVAVDVDDLEALLHAVQQPALSFTAKPEPIEAIIDRARNARIR